MRYEHDHGCPTPDEFEEKRAVGRRCLLTLSFVIVMLLLGGVFVWLDARAATENIYWRVDLHQGSSIIAYGQGTTEQLAWEDCFRLQAITRAMTAAETRRNAVSAVTTTVVRWCQTPKRYANVRPDPTGTATLNWQHEQPPPTRGFEVRYTIPGGTELLAQVPGGATARTFTLTGLAPGVYSFVVVALGTCTGTPGSPVDPVVCAEASPESNISAKVVM